MSPVPPATSNTFLIEGYLLNVYRLLGDKLPSYCTN